MNNNLSIHPPWLEKHTGGNLTLFFPSQVFKKDKVDSSMYYANNICIKFPQS